ncbi:uncharacterized protein I206_102463 [Kwoniella pini CBS 10737]|uniref:Uncharacterized protein n=1 Tax=Kwoniella pini CBS 10737 TaxID=1296096 RepID=A0A1B9I5F8_9TREE|nr:uncharacterized protein I206_02814 [Kwoniella pini CBS 10737]OCF50758.1 hypothetical protein I206_02814 [Kwoniella pini CBS 10737]
MSQVNNQPASRGIITSPPTAKADMSTRSATIGTSTPGRESNSGNSSTTAVDTGQVMPGLSSSVRPSSEGNEDMKNGKTKYEQWYPGDASHDGRPAWWNKVVCCGYGLGCLLCPCSSWNCKHERS